MAAKSKGCKGVGVEGEKRRWEEGRGKKEREKTEFNIVGIVMYSWEAPAGNLNVKTCIRLGEGGIHDWRGTQKGFWGTGNILFLDLLTGYIGSICNNSSNCTHVWAFEHGYCISLKYIFHISLKYFKIKHVLQGSMYYFSSVLSLPGWSDLKSDLRPSINFTIKYDLFLSKITLNS